jgi:hypothetical protein
MYGIRRGRQHNTPLTAKRRIKRGRRQMNMRTREKRNRRDTYM